VTSIDLQDLVQPTVLTLDLDLDDARRRLDGDGQQFAVVIDDDARLWGYLQRERANGDGKVADRLRRLDAWVRVSDTLKDAFGEVLLYDAGWVAVLDADDRFLGVLTPEALYAATRRSIDEHRD
jgi:osmoprotectant transport system ATP-binding protein